MADRSRAKFWNRSRPVIGGASGLFIAASLHLNGVPEDAWLHDSLTTLFGTAPLVGYALCVGGGTFVAWVFRAFEDRYVYD